MDRVKAHFCAKSRLYIIYLALIALVFGAFGCSRCLVSLSPD